MNNIIFCHNFPARILNFARVDKQNEYAIIFLMLGGDSTVERRDPLASVEQELRERLTQETQVINPDPRDTYIVFPSINVVPDPEVIELAAELITAHYQKLGQSFDYVTGIQYSGGDLSYAVARRMKSKKAPSRKDISTPGAWEHPIYVNGGSTSHTTGVLTSHAFNIPPGRVLLIDDFLAEGKQAPDVISTLKADGRDVEFAVLVEKTWQGGGDRVRDLTGVDPFHAVGLKGLDQNPQGIWMPVFEPPQFS